MRRSKRPPDQEKNLADDAKLIRQWRAYHQEKLEEALTGAHGFVVSQLMKLPAPTSSAETLLAAMRRHDWNIVDGDVRFTLLHEINEAVMRIHDKRGLPPIDDGFDHEPDGVFRLAKQILFPPSPDPQLRHLKSQNGTTGKTPAQPPGD